MDYEHEVFLSYRRGERLAPGGAFALENEGRWVHNVFLQEFKSRLDNHYPGARVAIDVDIPFGDPWEATLQRWVLRSRCLVAVWSPMYFRSPHCRSEFHSMLAREPAGAGNGSPLQRKFVIPLAWADGQWFDDEAKASQYSKDFSQFSPFVKPIENEERRALFIAAMDRLCAAVAVAIAAAPPKCDPAWTWKETHPLPPANAYRPATLRA